jgi:predicted amidophosphoribosyltransferase
MNHFIINHKKCPECGGRIKGYYYYCGQCGNQDVVNWKFSGALLMIAGAIFFLVIYFTTKNFCANLLFSQVPFCKYF